MQLLQRRLSFDSLVHQRHHNWWLAFGLYHSNLTPMFLKYNWYTFCVKALSRVTIMIINLHCLLWGDLVVFECSLKCTFMTASCMGVVIPNSSLHCYCDCCTVARLPCSVSDCGLSGFCVILQSWNYDMLLNIRKIIICTLYGFLVVFGQSLKCTSGCTLKKLKNKPSHCQQSINTIFICCNHMALWLFFCKLPDCVHVKESDSSFLTVDCRLGL